jgi:HlyD family secretion protein
VKFSKKWLIIAGLVVAVGIFAAFALNRKEKVQYFTQKVEHGDIREVVEATGTINAVITVQVGSQVSGTIQNLYADFNSRVKKGQVIAQLDQSLYRGALLQAKADYANAVANLAAAKANLQKAEATAQQTRADYNRTVGLAKEGVMSQQQLDLAKANSQTADAAVSAAQAQVTQASAQTQQKEAAVKVAETNLAYTVIHAPVDGVVIARNVDVGQTVAASLQAPTLFVIAQDLTKMQVYTSTDESDVGMIKVGQPVTFKVDAFPSDTFRGRVSQIRMNATTVQNVVTYTTIVDFDNPELKLFPGMTAYVTIPVATAQNVIKVPNGALRFKPDLPAQDLRALLQKNGIVEGGGARAGAQGGAAGQTASAAGGQGRRGGNGGQGGSGGYQRRLAGQNGEQPGGGAAQNQPREQRLDIAIIWKLLPDGKTLQPVRVRTGITDHTFTEIKQDLNGTLEDGDVVVVGAASTGSRPSNMPGVGGPPRR